MSGLRTGHSTSSSVLRQGRILKFLSKPLVKPQFTFKILMSVAYILWGCHTTEENIKDCKLENKVRFFHICYRG